MSNELVWDTEPGQTIYACRFQKAGNVFLADGASDEVYGAGGNDRDDYDVAMPEKGVGSGHYVGDFDAGTNITAGLYPTTFYRQIGANPADSDKPIGLGIMRWSGNDEIYDADAANLLAFTQLMTRSDSAIVSDKATELAAINGNEGSGAGDYTPIGDSQEGISDRTLTEPDIRNAVGMNAANLDNQLEAIQTTADDIKTILDYFFALETTIASGAPNGGSPVGITSFNLTAGSPAPDVYNNFKMTILSTESPGGIMTKNITDWAGAGGSNLITFDSAFALSYNDGDKILIWNSALTLTASEIYDIIKSGGAGDNAAILEDTGTTIPTAISNLNNITAADVVAALLAETGITAGGTWTYGTIIKVLTAWAVGKWRDKAGFSGTYQILDPDDDTTVIAEITPSATTPQKVVVFP